MRGQIGLARAALLTNGGTAWSVYRIPLFGVVHSTTSSGTGGPLRLYMLYWFATITTVFQTYMNCIGYHMLRGRTFLDFFLVGTTAQYVVVSKLVSAIVEFFFICSVVSPVRRSLSLIIL